MIFNNLIYIFIYIYNRRQCICVHAAGVVYIARWCTQSNVVEIGDGVALELSGDAVVGAGNTSSFALMLCESGKVVSLTPSSTGGQEPLNHSYADHGNRSSLAREGAGSLVRDQVVLFQDIEKRMETPQARRHAMQKSLFTSFAAYRSGRSLGVVDVDKVSHDILDTIGEVVVEMAFIIANKSALSQSSSGMFTVVTRKYLLYTIPC